MTNKELEVKVAELEKAISTLKGQMLTLSLTRYVTTPYYFYPTYPQYFIPYEPYVPSYPLPYVTCGNTITVNADSNTITYTS